MSLIELFEKQNQTVPQSQKPIQKLPSFKPLILRRESSGLSETSEISLHKDSPSTPHLEGIEPGAGAVESLVGHNEPTREGNGTSLIESFVSRDSKERVPNPTSTTILASGEKALSKDKQKLVRRLVKDSGTTNQPDDYEDALEVAESDALLRGAPKAVDDFNQRIAEQQPDPETDTGPSAGEQRHIDVPVESTASTASSSGVVQNAFDRMRPRRVSPEIATITIGSKTTTSVLGSTPLSKRRKMDQMPSTPARADRMADASARDKFSSSLRSFAAPESQLLKTVGKPQSKVRVSIDYSENTSQDEVSERASDTESAVSDAEASEQDQASAASEVGEDLTNDASESQSQQLDAKSGSEVEIQDEEEKKSREDAKVAQLIRQAEESSTMKSQDNKRRAHQMLKATGRKDSTVSLTQIIDTSVQKIQEQLSVLETEIRQSLHTSDTSDPLPTPSIEDTTPEDRLSLTVSKSDFLTMHVAGQFNLGFILATRKSSDLFIIDQHASDEKYNFERLQATTVVQNQRLVHPHPLELTAIEEETVLDNQDALLKNGFVVDIDTSGDLPVGQRCHLLSLPMSKEVTFSPADLEELLTLLAESPTHNPSSTSTSSIPRPSKVRRMFAMRACRSSIMIGKTLTMRQMEGLVRKMGGVDKPWNCPHGRPTMRHVCGLEEWGGWREGDGIVGLEDGGEEVREGVDWKGWVEERMAEGESGEMEEEEGEEEMVEGSEEGVEDEEEEEEEDADADE